MMKRSRPAGVPEEKAISNKRYRNFEHVGLRLGFETASRSPGLGASASRTRTDERSGDHGGDGSNDDGLVASVPRLDLPSARAARGGEARPQARRRPVRGHGVGPTRAGLDARPDEPRAPDSPGCPRGDGI